MVLLLAAVIVMQVQDEVRVSSHRYVPQSPYTLRVDTKVVEISATVRDFHGAAVSGLTKDNFQILDNGKARLIEAFEVDKTSDLSLKGEKAAALSPEIVKSSTPAALPSRPPRFLALFPLCRTANREIGEPLRSGGTISKKISNWRCSHGSPVKVSLKSRCLYFARIAKSGLTREAGRRFCAISPERLPTSRTPSSPSWNR
jgi:hypothetical protein